MSVNKKLEKNPFYYHSIKDLPVHEIVAKFSEKNSLSPALATMTGVSQITKTLSAQLGEFTNTRNILSSNLNDQIFVANRISKQLLPLFELSKTLNELKLPFAEISKNLVGIRTNQLEISRNLSKIISSVNVDSLNHFNGFETAIQNISNDFIDRSIIDRNWENLNFAEEVVESISKETDNIANNSDKITLEDLNLFENNLIQELNSLLSKTKSQKATYFIAHLITVVSFILNLYLLNKEFNDYNNKEVLNQTRKQIDSLNSSIESQFNEVFSKLNKNRTASKNVKLTTTNRKKAKIIGTVLKGQKVTVIEIRHKYLLIAYIDKNTKEPRSGFVIKKYFELQK